MQKVFSARVKVQMMGPLKSLTVKHFSSCMSANTVSSSIQKNEQFIAGYYNAGKLSCRFYKMPRLS